MENLTAWHPVNRHIPRVNNVSFSLRRGEILDIAGLVGAGRTETVQCLFGVWPGRWQGDIWINGKAVRITDCRAAIAPGIAMVPEDRKKDGIVPLMAVGKISPWRRWTSSATGSQPLTNRRAALTWARVRRSIC